MIKKLTGIFFAFCLLLLPLAVYAAKERVEDNAGLFTSTEIEALEQRAQELSEKYGTDVFILTDYQYGYSNNYARDALEEYGVENYPNGYVGYMINMADRSYWVDAYGPQVRQVFTQDVTDTMSNRALGQLRQGNYYSSAMAVLDEAERQIQISGPMGWLKKLFLYPGEALTLVMGSGLFALAGAGIATAMQSARHKDKYVAGAAAQYGSNFAVTGSANRFIRHYQTRMPVPKVQHSRGSGGGGGGGSFGHTGSGGHF